MKPPVALHSWNVDVLLTNCRSDLFLPKPDYA
eukprot:COSAG02_NODE_62289_length_266_cov_0.622754_1_plen_31_part_10